MHQILSDSPSVRNGSGHSALRQQLSRRQAVLRDCAVRQEGDICPLAEDAALSNGQHHALVIGGEGDPDSVPPGIAEATGLVVDGSGRGNLREEESWLTKLLTKNRVMLTTSDVTGISNKKRVKLTNSDLHVSFRHKQGHVDKLRRNVSFEQ
jgi:hypothetical protein